MLSQDAYDELKKYQSPYTPVPDEYERFNMLKKAGYLRLNHFAFTRHNQSEADDCDNWIITSLGRDALLEFEQERDKQAEDKRQRRFQNKISVLSVLVPFITFLLGLVVEHYAGLLAWLASLLK